MNQQLNIIPTNSPNASTDLNDSWRNTVESLLDTVTAAGGGDVPERVLRAAELLMNGSTYQEVGEALGVSRQTVRNWVLSYPGMQSAIDLGKSRLSEWRMALLGRQFVDAADFSKKLLSLDPDVLMLPPKTLALIQKQAMFIMEKMTRNSGDGGGTSTESLQATASALAYIAQVAAEMNTPQMIEGVVREIKEDE